METIAMRNTVNLKRPIVLIAGILFILGLVFWVMQLLNGVPTYSNQYAWGIYLAGFFAAVACGAGAMFAACLLSFEGSKPAPLYLAGFASFVAAGCTIMADLGSPFDIFNLIFTSNFGAPMVLDFWMLAVCAVLCLIGAFTALGANKGFGAVCACLAVILLGTEAWLISMSAVQHLWGISMGAAPSLLQALIAGLALALILRGADNRFLRGAFCLLLLLFLAANLIDAIAGRAVNGSLGLQWQALFSSGIFWVGLLIGCVVPLALAFKGLGLLAGITALFGIFCTKLAYMWSGAAVSSLDIFAPATPHLGIPELLVVLGFCALGILVYHILKAVKHA